MYRVQRTNKNPSKLRGPTGRVGFPYLITIAIFKITPSKSLLNDGRGFNAIG